VVKEGHQANEYFSNTSVTAEPTFTSHDNSMADKWNTREPEDKGGIKGLLRKATRVFERRTNIQTTTEDNKLLVGVFAVSLN
jgi:hypothetical protein